jgi:hypothetical protein
MPQTMAGSSAKWRSPWMAGEFSLDPGLAVRNFFSQCLDALTQVLDLPVSLLVLALQSFEMDDLLLDSFELMRDGKIGLGVAIARGSARLNHAK